MTHDKACLESIQSSANMIVPWVLMASYLYYIRDESLLSDGLYDRLCSILRDHYDSIEHRHKNLISREELIGGSLSSLSDDDYPLITKDTAVGLITQPKKRKRKRARTA